MNNPIEFAYILTQIMRCVDFVLDTVVGLFTKYFGYNFIVSAILLAVLCSRLFGFRFSPGLNAGRSDSVKRVKEHNPYIRK